MTQQVRMQHAKYGERVVDQRQVEAYERTHWTRVGDVAPDGPTGTVDEVLAQVGDDKAQARRALDAEQSRSHPRSTLVAALLRVIDTDQEV